MSYESSFKEGIKPDPDIDFLEWVNEYFYLPRESTSEYGKYRSWRTPMVEEILKELSPKSKTQEVVVMKPTQLAGTTAAIIFMLASADISPAPGMCIEPTGNLAKSFSKKKLQPSINATITGSGRLKGKFSETTGRDGSNTILEKTFPGGSWRIDGSNSPAVYRGESVRYIILDDFDGFESDIGGEGVGHDIYISSVGIDTGGHHTQLAYDYCRKRLPRVFALKGANAKNKPIVGKPTKQDVDFKGEIIKDGVQLWPIGTDTAKALIYNRLRIVDPGPGCCHWYIGLDENFFRQLTAEKLVTRFVKGFPVQEWVKAYRRNEALDCTVYSYAAALKMGIQRADWKKIKEVVTASVPSASKPTKKLQKSARPRRRIISQGVR